MTYASAMYVMPTNRTASSAAMTVRVVAAFLDSGLWNAGTPLAMASTPVSATEPLANARRTSRMVSGSSGLGAPGSGLVAVLPCAQDHDLVDAEHDHESAR